MKALISPNESAIQVTGWELVENAYQPVTQSLGFRVAEVRSGVFDVAPPLFWVDCPTETETWWYYDTATGLCKPSPESVPQPVVSSQASNSGVEKL